MPPRTGLMHVTVFGFDIELDGTVLAASADEIGRQVREYADGERRRFDLGPRYPEGFTGRVMRAIDAIPYGETRTYADLADEIGTAPIAVGQGCGRNPVPVVVPCHRVVRSDGGLGGYSAGGDRALELKQELLAFEAG